MVLEPSLGRRPAPDGGGGAGGAPRGLKYPPFAAQLFQALGILPLKTAVWLFYVASVGLILVAIWLSRDIVQRLEPVLCLLGIQAFAAKREVAAGGWLVAATAIKLTPVFFLPWVIIRGTRRSLQVMLLLFVLSVAWSQEKTFEVRTGDRPA
jgi:hypothetical protein